MWLQKNIKNPKNGRTPFSNAVLLFNAIKNLRRFEKGKDDFSYTPLFVTDDTDKSDGLDNYFASTEEHVKYLIQGNRYSRTTTQTDGSTKANLFFTEDDANGWLDDAAHTETEQTEISAEEGNQKETRKLVTDTSNKKTPKKHSKIKKNNEDTECRLHNSHSMECDVQPNERPRLESI